MAYVSAYHSSILLQQRMDECNNSLLFVLASQAPLEEREDLSRGGSGNHRDLQEA